MAAQRVFVLIVPLLTTPLIGFLIADGYLDFGAGEKDLYILIPWGIWSLFFIVSGSVLWRKKISFKVWVFKSLTYSVIITLVLWLCLLMYSVVSTR
jgi:hypothetical protein